MSDSPATNTIPLAVRNGTGKVRFPMSDSPVTDTIPPPEEIRERLKKTLREAALLRRLLRLAQQAERDRQESPVSQGERVRRGG